MSKENSSTNASGGFCFIGLITISFIIFKVLNVITWSWIWVLSPIWIPAIIVLLISIASIILSRD